MAPSKSFLCDFGTFSSITNAGITILVLGITYAIYIREATPLRSIPGPFLASITRLWIFQKQRGLQRQQVDIDLRKKYGPIVRISPNEVMVSSPKSMKTIYGETFFNIPNFELMDFAMADSTTAKGAGSKFRKGDWYQATGDCGWSGLDELDFLSELNMEKYRLQRRLIGPAYTENSMKDVESNMNTILEKNINIMRRREGRSENVDIFFNFFALGESSPIFQRT